MEVILAKLLRSWRKWIGTDPWKPTLNQSSQADAAIQAIRNMQFEMEFKADYDA
jgi:hypothetical protein